MSNFILASFMFYLGTTLIGFFVDRRPCVNIIGVITVSYSLIQVTYILVSSKSISFCLIAQ